MRHERKMRLQNYAFLFDCQTFWAIFSKHSLAGVAKEPSNLLILNTATLIIIYMELEFGVLFVILPTMKRLSVLLFVVLFAELATLRADVGRMKDVFVGMPDSLMPMLSQNARKDLIDFYESNMKAVLDNEWGSKSQILEMKEDYMVLREDPDGTVTTQMALLSRGRDTLVCLVRTILTPQPDSELTVYTSSWQEVPQLAQIKGFADLERNKGVVDYTQISLKPQSDGRPTLTLTLDVADGEADKKDSPRATMVYKWNGQKFLKQ